MKEILLLETIYGPFKRSLMGIFKKELKSLLEDLEINIETITITKSNNIYIRFSGLDEEFAYNLIKKEYHICQEIEKFEVDSIVYSKLVEVGKYGFGIFSNIGALKEDNFIDALIPLFVLRKQLLKNKKYPCRKIIDLYGLVSEMPVELLITSIDIDNLKIQAEFSKKQLDIFKSWINEGLDRINFGGIYENKIRKILKKTGHDRDIVKIEKLGLFEFSLVCKEGTEAPGIISKIGPYLPAIEMNAFVSKKLDKILEL